MSVDLKTMTVEPRRQTFGHLARRFGEDRAATRYEEGTLDVQATDHFHYKPLWEPEFDIYDVRKTAVVMKDWYDLKDPRQYYYATYNIARAGMRQAAEHNFDFVEKRDMLKGVSADWMQTVAFYLLPLRHVAWGANMNAANICDRGYGTAVTAPSIFTAGDQLGIAQLIGQIGLIMGEGTGEVLDAAKANWMNAPEWQGVRKLVEDTLVVKDWFELFVAQNLVIDGLVYPLVYERFDAEGQKHGGAAISMLTEFMSEWFAEHARWVDAVVKVAAAESAQNKALISGWFATWRDQAGAALKPLSGRVLGGAGDGAVNDVIANLNTRAQKLGLDV